MLSVQNASTHGIFKSPFVLRNEPDALVLQLETELIEEWELQGPTETALVDQLVICRWRLRRIWEAEAAAIDLQIDDDAAELARKYFLNLLQRYDTSLSRQFDRALVRLRQLKCDRASQPQPDQPDTRKLQNEPKPATQLQAVLNIEDARRLFGALGYELPKESA